MIPAVSAPSIRRQPQAQSSRTRAAAPTVNPTPVHFGTDSFVRNRPLRFLLVEDSPEVIWKMVTGLEAHQPQYKKMVADALGISTEAFPRYEVCAVAKTYDNAVSLFRQEKPDFILLDWDLADSLYYPRYRIQPKLSTAQEERQEVKTGHDFRKALIQSGFPADRILWISSRHPSEAFNGSPNLSKKWWPHPNGKDWSPVLTGELWEGPDYFQRIKAAVDTGLNKSVPASAYQLEQGVLSLSKQTLQGKRWLLQDEHPDSKPLSAAKLRRQKQSWEVDLSALRQQWLAPPFAET